MENADIFLDSLAIEWYQSDKSTSEFEFEARGKKKETSEPDADEGAGNRSIFICFPEAVMFQH